VLSRLRSLLLAATVVLASAPNLLAQVGGTTDIITGKVTGPSGEPIADATVEVVSVETQVSRERATDAHGRFTILFPDGGGQYLVLVRYIGMKPLRLSVARQADEGRLAEPGPERLRPGGNRAGRRSSGSTCSFRPHQAESHARAGAGAASARSRPRTTHTRAVGQASGNHTRAGDSAAARELATRLCAGSSG